MASSETKETGTTTSNDEIPKVTYGFIGLGVMGFGMAQNLRKGIPTDSKLVVCELVKERRDKFLEETEGKIDVAENPKEVAELCDIIITMLPKGPHVHDCFTNSGTGLLQAKSTTPKFFIESSTIDVATSSAVSSAVESSSTSTNTFIDAPVSGGPNGAYAGSLTFMVGGTSALYNRALPILRLMGKKDSIFHCGPAGAGLATKSINNYLSAISFIGVSEAMNMGIRYGLDPKVLAGVINVSSGRCYNSEDQNPVKGVTGGAASERDFEGGFSTELCLGVVEMAVELGKEVGLKSVLSGVVLDVLERAVKDERCSGKDCRSVYRLFAEDDGKALE